MTGDMDKANTGRHNLTAADRQRVTDEQRAAREQRDINQMLHAMLLIGLVISTALMLVGLGLAILQGTAVPTTTSDLAEVLPQVAAFNPSGFLTLGLLVLIATPILRVVGSIVAFIYERDWRYAFVTFLVFMVVMVSLITGHG